MQVSSANAGKDVLLISADHFEDSELLQPFQKLNEEGLTIDIASLQRGTITGKHGMQVSADLRVDEIDPDHYSMLLLPGGKAPETLRQSPEVLAIARQFMEQNRPVAAICHGPQILISAGVMEGRTATAYSSVAEELKQAGANYIDQEVVIDDNLITSRNPDDLPAFIHAILNQMHEA